MGKTLKSLMGTTFEIPYNMDFNTCIDATLQAGTFECTINGQYDIKYIFWEDGEASGRTYVDRLVEFQYITVGSTYVIRNGSTTDGMYDGWYLVNNSGLTPLGETITISNITSVEATSEGFTDILLANNVDIKNGDWTFDTPHILYNGSVIQELSDKEVVLECAGKKMLSDIVIVNPVVEEEEVKVSTFEIWNTRSHDLDKTFEYEDGMTWEEFINSEYNTGLFAIYGTNNNIVGISGTYVYIDEAGAVKAYITDVINQTKYYTKTSSGEGGGAN